jgi:hypothetical protein
MFLRQLLVIEFLTRTRLQRFELKTAHLAGMESFGSRQIKLRRRSSSNHKSSQVENAERGLDDDIAC